MPLFFSNGTNLKYHGDVATISCSVEPLVCKERYAYHDGGRYNSVNIFTRNLSSGRFEVLCHVGSKFFREFSKEAIQLRNIYKDPTRSLSHRSTRNRGNVMSVGPDLFGKLLVRTGNLNPLGLESQEGFTSGDAANRRLEIGHDYGEEGVYTSRNELELPTSSTNYEEEDTIIDQQKLKPILPMMREGLYHEFVFGRTEGDSVYARSVDELLFQRNGMKVDDENNYHKNGNGDADDAKNGKHIESKEFDNSNEKDISSRTTKVLRLLYSEKKLSKKGKKAILSDVISRVGLSEFSKAEMAFSLILCRGRPGVDSINISTRTSCTNTIADLDSEDVADFEDLCQSILKAFKK